MVLPHSGVGQDEVKAIAIALVVCINIPSSDPNSSPKVLEIKRHQVWWVREAVLRLNLYTDTVSISLEKKICRIHHLPKLLMVLKMVFVTISKQHFEYCMSIIHKCNLWATLRQDENNVRGMNIITKINIPAHHLLEVSV